MVRPAHIRQSFSLLNLSTPKGRKAELALGGWLHTMMLHHDAVVVRVTSHTQGGDILWMKSAMATRPGSQARYPGTRLIPILARYRGRSKTVKILKLESCIVLNEHNIVFARSGPLYTTGVSLQRAYPRPVIIHFTFVVLLHCLMLRLVNCYIRIYIHIHTL